MTLFREKRHEEKTSKYNDEQCHQGHFTLCAHVKANCHFHFVQCGFAFYLCLAVKQIKLDLDHDLMLLACVAFTCKRPNQIYIVFTLIIIIQDECFSTIQMQKKPLFSVIFLLYWKLCKAVNSRDNSMALNNHFFQCLD